MQPPSTADALLILLSQARLAAAQYCNLFIVGEQIQVKCGAEDLKGRS